MDLKKNEQLLKRKIYQEIKPANNEHKLKVYVQKCSQMILLPQEFVVSKEIKLSLY